MSKPRVVVLYNFFDDPNDNSRLRNFKTFVDWGCSNRVQLIILKRGASKYVEWLADTFTVLDVVNKGICINGYKHGINFVIKQGIEFDFMLLMNDSMVGPFLQDQTSSWYDVLIRAMDDYGADAISPYMCPSSKRPFMMSGCIFLRKRCVPCLIRLFDGHVINDVRKAKRIESKISRYLQNNGFIIAGIHEGHWSDSHVLHDVVFDKGNRIGKVRSIVSRAKSISCVTDMELQSAMQAARRDNGVLKDMRDSVSLIRQSSILDLQNPTYVESLIVRTGLNTELEGRPPTVEIRDGAGLRISQYPNQFRDYLMFMATYKVASYMEVGCGWGGNFIFTLEYLRRLLTHGHIKGVAVDTVDSPVKSYCEGESDTRFIQADSTSDAFRSSVSGQRFDVVCIAGRSYEGTKSQFTTFWDKSDMFVFLRIASPKNTGVARFWKEEIQRGSDFMCHEFVENREDKAKTFLGIGVAVRKKIIHVNS